jgi:two-component system chemotaxis response regulator CheB
MVKNPPNKLLRDIVVIGSSAGGVEALPRLLHQLPRTLPGSICIVQHMAASSKPYLVEILSRTSPLPVSWAEQGSAVEHGHVYVAPPDVHMLFTDDHLRLTKTARENHSRPSIDKLFRSAATQHGSRVIGVLLTGMLEDGVAGLRAIHDTGGVVIVQDPADAAFPDLPSNALHAVQPDHLLPLDAIPDQLVQLLAQPVAPMPVPRELELEAEIDSQEPLDPRQMQQLGPQSQITCPECSGPMWQLGDPRTRRFRCYLGHVSSARQVLEASAEQVDRALWSAIRALTDRATTLETLAHDAEAIGSQEIAEAYESRALEARDQAQLARGFMSEVIRPQ